MSHPTPTLRSPDTLRATRLPPGQSRVLAIPVEHPGAVPNFDPATWDFTLFPRPLIDEVKQFTWAEVSRWPRVTVFADLHSPAGWSRLDNLWDGIPTRELLNHIAPAPEVKFAMIHAEHGVSTCLPLDDLFAEDCLFALRHDGRDLTAEEGAPVRLIVPRRWSTDSLKWVRGVEFMIEERPGTMTVGREGPWPITPAL